MRVMEHGLRVLQLRAEASDALEEASAATPAEYEEAGRRHLRENFERLFGLRILETAMAQRAGAEIVSLSGASFEWDFRVPVNVSGSPSFSNSPVSLIYPSRESYLRPARPVRARELTPTKLPGGAASASDFMAIFEITTTRRWPNTGLLERLERRLAVSLDRARDLNRDSSELGILDVVAVVGVLGTDGCLRSVSDRLARRSTMPLLTQMADAARFVFILRSYATTD